MKKRKFTGLAVIALLYLAGCGTGVDPFAGLEQAQREAQYFSSQLTATAEAPMLAITGTMGAMSIEQTQTAYPYTATALAWTPTPMPTSTLVPTATPNIIATGTAESILLAMERDRDTNNMRAMRSYVVGILGLFIVMMFAVSLAKRISKIPTPIHEGTGKPMPMLDVVDGTWADIDKAANGVARIDKAYLNGLPTITGERQDAVTARAQMIDLKSRTRVSSAAVQKLLESQGLNKAMPAGASQLATPTVSDDDLNLPLPPWEFILQWNGQSKPLGFGRQGLITAKAASPHILVAGKSGAGKTRYMLRPLTAASLAKGEVVINLGHSEIGFGIFEEHANYHNARLQKPTDIVECLARVYDELKERKTLLGGMDTEWEHWQGGMPPRPFVTLLMDELENLSEEIYTDYDNGPAICREMWSYVTRIAKEGRKTGIVFNAALQDGTSKSIDLRFRRNCTLVAFQLGDQSHSNSFLGSSGAEALTVGRFMARTDGVVIGGGFEPTDDEIRAYLGRHRVVPAEKPKWIEAANHPRIESRDEPITESLPETKPADEIAEMAERIRSQWTPGMSGRQVATKLLGLSQYGGSLKTKTDKVIEYLTATTPAATTTEMPPEMGIFEPAAG